jgi:hypothetical protein
VATLVVLNLCPHTEKARDLLKNATLTRPFKFFEKEPQKRIKKRGKQEIPNPA